MVCSTVAYSLGLHTSLTPQAFTKSNYSSENGYNKLRQNEKKKKKGKRKNIKSSNNQPVQGKVIYETNCITEKKHYNY